MAEATGHERARASRPGASTTARTRYLVLSALLAALLAASAWIAIPVGAVPVTLQVFIVLLAGLILPARWAAAYPTAPNLKGFIVRKEAKEHGKGRSVEGPVEAGQRAIIVEDTITTGGSALKAIARAREFGLDVIGALAVVDRLEGGEEAFAEIGVPLRALLTIRDLGVEPAA